MRKPSEISKKPLKEYTRERVPLDWAATQTALGIALKDLGEREAGTARLEAAVTAYREALKEQTRERVPLNWAMTQHNLGIALMRLGERENSTARFEASVMAYQEALKEYTRERGPLDWAMTQSSLGKALKTALPLVAPSSSNCCRALVIVTSVWNDSRVATR